MLPDRDVDSKRLLAALACAGLLVSAAPAAAGSALWGITEPTVLSIPAAAFLPRRSDVAWTWEDGHIRVNSVPEGQGAIALWAAVNLPTGALLEDFGIQYLDADTGADNQELEAILRLQRGLQSPTHEDIARLASVEGTSRSRHCSALNPPDPACPFPIARTVVNEGQQLVVLVRWNSVTPSSHHRFKGVELTWRRQVSDPPPHPTFADVPETHSFRREIEALAAAGITSGCATGLYCPDNPVTREQMAIFLSRALGLSWHPHLTYTTDCSAACAGDAGREQVLRLDASAFAPLSDAEAWTQEGGTVLHVTASAWHSPELFTFWAPIELPSGLRLTQLGVSGSGSAGSGNPSAVIRSYQSDGSHTDHAVAVAGNGDLTLPCGLLIDNAEGRKWVVLVSASSGHRLGGVSLGWVRTVSEPPATPSFTDVPATHMFYAAIEALRASGITSGCNAPADPPAFCPDNTLTRGQMAKFLAVGLGLDWPF